MTKRRIADEWAAYPECVVPLGASAAQVLDTRNAFYAGALSLATLIMSQMTAGPEVTEADDAAIVAVLEELQAFSERGGAA